MASATYKFISGEIWFATDDAGERTCPSVLKNPYARVNSEGTEVVISCNCGDGTHTASEAKSYIEDNWTAVEAEV